MAKEQKVFVLSDGNKANSKGYKIDLNGLDITRFSTNPVMLYEHDKERVLGRWTNIVKNQNKLIASPEFDMEDEEAKRIAGKVERGFIKGASVGIIVIEAEYDGIDDIPTVTRSELFEASIVSIPADSGAVTLYNDKLECLSVDELKLNIQDKQKKEQEGDFEGFFKDVCWLLVLDTGEDIKTVLEAIKRLLKTKEEERIESALNLDILTVSESQIYLKLLRSGDSKILQVLDEKIQDFKAKEKDCINKLYEDNHEKITTYLSVFGWKEVEKLGYETAKMIVGNLPERIYLSRMIDNGSGVKDLEWYRKNNPKALRDNPELYQTLMSRYNKK